MKHVPDHVPAGVVVDFDYFNQPGMKEGPHALFGDLFKGRSPRIVYSTANGGHWIIGGYNELFDAARNTDVFSSSSMQIPAMDDEPVLYPLNADPPEHATYRKLLEPGFTPAKMFKMTDRIRNLTDELLANFKDKGKVDFVKEMAEPLPIIIFMTIAGIPLDRFRIFRDNVASFIKDPTNRTSTLEYLNREITVLAASKRANPEDDLISQIVQSDLNGEPITDADVQALILLLLFAGLDTVTNGMSFGMHRLASDPELQETLRADPKQIPLAVEELLRRYAFAVMGRILKQDVEFHGLTMKNGDRVLFAPPGAGLDPAAFPDPEALDITRKDKGAPAFGFGPHRCVGMHLARLELRILYEEWLKQIPTFTLSASNPPSFHGGVVLGLEHLTLEWDAAGAR